MNPRIPPPIIFFIHMMLVWLAARYIPQAEIDIPGQRAIVQVMGVAGVAISIVAMGLFRRAKTTIDPLKPQKAVHIVMNGVYRYTRNPMYLGLVLILLAWVVWKSNLTGLLFVASCIWYLTEFQIKPEERALEEKFGDEYRDYKRKVRRWI